MARALLVGRFQPFHLGHLEVVRSILEDFDTIVVGIGSSQASHTPANPFTAGERVDMIHGALMDEDLPEHFLIPIPDLHRNSLWVRHVESLVPSFDVFFSNNGLPRRLFAEAGYEVRGIPFHERDRFTATRIRRLLHDGGPWEELVPPFVARVIRDIDGPGRMRDILAPDSSVDPLEGEYGEDQDPL